MIQPQEAGFWEIACCAGVMYLDADMGGDFEGCGDCEGLV
jgi:hypothetical protein